MFRVKALQTRCIKLLRKNPCGVCLCLFVQTCEAGQFDMVGLSLFVFKFVLGDCFWGPFWGPFLDSFLAPVLGAEFWAL